MDRILEIRESNCGGREVMVGVRGVLACEVCSSTARFEVVGIGAIVTVLEQIRYEER